MTNLSNIMKLLEVAGYPGQDVEAKNLSGLNKEMIDSVRGEYDEKTLMLIINGPSCILCLKKKKYINRAFCFSCRMVVDQKLKKKNNIVVGQLKKECGPIDPLAVDRLKMLIKKEQEAIFKVKKSLESKQIYACLLEKKRMRLNWRMEQVWRWIREEEKKKKEEEEEERILSRRKRNREDILEKKKKGMPRGKIFKQVQLELKLFAATSLYYRKKKTLKKNRKVYMVPPEEMVGLFRKIEHLWKAEKEKKIKKLLRVPGFLRKHFQFCRQTVTAAALLDLFRFYNLCYNIYWVCESYGFHLIKNWSSAVWPIFKEKGIKIPMCAPFETFLNDCVEEYQQIKRTKDQAGKKDLYWSCLASYGIIIKDLQGSHDVLTSFLFSLYMGKKNLHFADSSTVEKCLEDHKKLMMRDTEIDPEFERFVIEETARLFGDWKMRVNEYHVPPDSSYYYKKEGVNLSDLNMSDDWDREDFLAFWKEDKLQGSPAKYFEDFMKEDHHHKIAVVCDSGKVRIISTNHPATFLMKNFQWCVHDHLKKKNIFFYIGAQVNNRIVLDEKKKRSDWILSGDYTNSTDFIPTDLTRRIYETILSKLQVGEWMNLKKLVKHNLEKEILNYPDGSSIEMKSGQLMGGLLSFPALCILNHCISKYVGISDNKKKINGDDLLAFCDKEQKKVWVDRSPSLGMSPNDSKSHIHPTYGTFNSQLLKVEGSRIHRLRHCSVSKLFASSLKDYCNENLGCKSLKELIPQFAHTWFSYHENIDLFTGDEYEEPFKDPIRQVSPFFWGFHKRVKTFIGKIGSMSKHYDKDNIDEMIDWRWNDIERDFFAAGDTRILVLQRLYDEGRREEEETKKIWRAVMESSVKVPSTIKRTEGPINFVYSHTK